MRTKEEQDAINKACKYHPKTKQELIKLVNDKRIYLGNIDTSAITDMSNLFSIIKDSRYIENNREEFTGIEDWDTSNVTKMDGMFAWCEKFNRPLNDWNVSKVSNMQAMFLRCYRFNQDISSWDVSSVTDMSRMFLWCKSFNQDLSAWCVSNVKDMHSMFEACYEFNQSLNDWNVSNVTNMKDMFNHCLVFNQPLNDWNVGNVEDMSSMFLGCDKFNQPLNNWDVSSVKNMDSMFNNAWNFNQDFEGWNVREDCLTNDIFKHTKHLEFKYFYESFTQDQIFKSGKSNIDPHFFRMTKEAFERYSSVESYGPLNANNIDKKSFRRS